MQTRARGGHHGQRRRDIRLRHGRAGKDCRPCQEDDPDERGKRHRDKIHRAPRRRETLRGGAQRERDHPPHLPRKDKDSPCARIRIQRRQRRDPEPHQPRHRLRRHDHRRRHESHRPRIQKPALQIPIPRHPLRIQA